LNQSGGGGGKDDSSSSSSSSGGDDWFVKPFGDDDDGTGGGAGGGTVNVSTTIKTLNEEEGGGGGGGGVKGYDLLWQALSNACKVRVVARAARVDDGPKRASRIRLLFVTHPHPDSSSSSTASSATTATAVTNQTLTDMPSSRRRSWLSSKKCGMDGQGRSLSNGPFSAGWVTVKESGVSFSFDVTRVMFCSGNVTERTRMANPPPLPPLPPPLPPLSLQVVVKQSDAKKEDEVETGGEDDREEEGEVVVDLYAGIGYYTIPLLLRRQEQSSSTDSTSKKNRGKKTKHGGKDGSFESKTRALFSVSHLHACEWNPDSVAALKFNLKGNLKPSLDSKGGNKGSSTGGSCNHDEQIAKRVTVWEGDNRITVLTRNRMIEEQQQQRHHHRGGDDDVGGVGGLRGLADRVLLGLIPSSRQGWPLAAAVVKPCGDRGAWLHVHDNVHQDCLRLLNPLASTLNGSSSSSSTLGQSSNLSQSSSSPASSPPTAITTTTTTTTTAMTTNHRWGSWAVNLAQEFEALLTAEHGSSFTMPTATTAATKTMTAMASANRRKANDDSSSSSSSHHNDHDNHDHDIDRRELGAWVAQVHHVEVVKSYAPRVLHVVADVFVFRKGARCCGAGVEGKAEEK
jgi:tRNA G37 N-methylase Trm5